MSDAEKWSLLYQEIEALRAFAIESRHTINAYRFLLEDVLAELAVLKPDPAKFLDNVVMRMHASFDAAVEVLNQAPAPSDTAGKLKAETNRQAMLAARAEYERIAETALSIARGS
jgi:hypothetical protein